MESNDARSPVRSMPCHKQKASGGICTATAIVEREDRTFESRVSWVRGGSFHSELLATRYFLVCPVCGAWERVIKAKPAEDVPRADAS